jgi:hypothetical protein
LVLAAVLGAFGAGFAWLKQVDAPVEAEGVAPARSTLSAIPDGALLLVTADLPVLRSAKLTRDLFEEGRQIPGLGPVDEVCGFDPLEGIREVALAIPSGGADGDFGLVATGVVPRDALLSCAAKVIDGRHGRAVRTTVGGFETVRDASLSEAGGEIAVREGGPALLGSGAYMRAMIDAADQRSPDVTRSEHVRLRVAIGESTLVGSVVLGEEQRAAVREELTRAGAEGGALPPAIGSVKAAAMGVTLRGEEISAHAVVACDGTDDAERVAAELESSLERRASDAAMRLLGFSAVLERVTIERRDADVHVSLGLAMDDAERLVKRLASLARAAEDRTRPGRSPAASAPAASMPGASMPGASMPGASMPGASAPGSAPSAPTPTGSGTP